MKHISLIIFITAIYACKQQGENLQNNTVSIADSMKNIQAEISDSIYKIGDFFFEAKKNATFEFVKKGEIPKLKTKGDTLYADNEVTLFGNIQEIVSPGIYKKFAFKAQFNDYKVDTIYKGKLSPPNFATDPNAKQFITRIKDGCKETGVNFAGKYTLVEWGCGALCQ